MRFYPIFYDWNCRRFSCNFVGNKNHLSEPIVESPNNPNWTRTNDVICAIADALVCVCPVWRRTYQKFNDIVMHSNFVCILVWSIQNTRFARTHNTHIHNATQRCLFTSSSSSSCSSLSLDSWLAAYRIACKIAFAKILRLPKSEPKFQFRLSEAKNSSETSSLVRCACAHRIGKVYVASSLALTHTQTFTNSLHECTSTGGTRFRFFGIFESTRQMNLSHKIHNLEKIKKLEMRNRKVNSSAVQRMGKMAKKTKQNEGIYESIARRVDRNIICRFVVSCVSKRNVDGVPCRWMACVKRLYINESHLI